MDKKLLARLRMLCAEPGPDDGVRAPRPRRKTSNVRKLRQLCGAVERTISLALGSSSDPLLNACWVESVEPFPDGSCLQIRVQTLDSIQVDALIRALQDATPWLRTEVAHAIQRRKTPRLVVDWAGPS